MPLRSLVFAILFGISGVTLGAGSVAMVTDLSGNVTASDGESESDTRSLRILERVRSDTKLILPEESHVTLHFPATRTDFRFQGPNVIRIGKDSAAGSETPAETRQHGDIGVSLDTRNSDLGAIAMRSLGDYSPGLRLQSPVDTVVLLSRPTEFRWQPDPGYSDFQFTLSTRAGQPVVSTFTGSPLVRLPHDISLQPDTAYRWSVRADSSDGDSTLASAEFSTASADIEARYFRLAALNRGEISNRVLYTLYLDKPWDCTSRRTLRDGPSNP